MAVGTERALRTVRQCGKAAATCIEAVARTGDRTTRTEHGQVQLDCRSSCLQLAALDACAIQSCLDCNNNSTLNTHNYIQQWSYTRPAGPAGADTNRPRGGGARTRARMHRLWPVRPLSSSLRRAWRGSVPHVCKQSRKSRHCPGYFAFSAQEGLDRGTFRLADHVCQRRAEWNHCCWRPKGKGIPH